MIGCGSCGGCEDRSAAPAVAEHVQPLAAGAPADPPPAPVAAPTEPASRKGLKPGFHEVELRDEVPLCVLADFEAQYNAKFIEQVEKQKLRAGRSIVIAAFAGWCVNEACDDRPSLECQVERQGNTLIVRSRYWGDRKDGARCENVPCRPVTAGCESPPLEAGVYTIQHGEKNFEVRVPSVLRSPCFGTDVAAPPE
jgi:hypothetical protein